MTIEVGGDLEISGHRVCIVYDTRTGRVLHIHESIALEGTRVLTDDALRTRSLELCSRFGAKQGANRYSRLETIVVAPEELPQDGPFMVNPKSLALMPARPVRPKARSRGKITSKQKVKRAGRRGA